MTAPADQDRLFVMGDVHGQLGKALGHLRAHGLIDDRYDWSGGTATLCFVGDYVNRGPSGSDVIHLVRHLQATAGEDGGEVIALLGNHDVAQLAARRFADDPERGPEYMQAWISNGGQAEDIDRMDDELAGWMANLAATAIVDGTLLMHADSDFYLAYGGTVETINAEIRKVLNEADPEPWRELMVRFADRHVFDETKPGGRDRAGMILDMLGASRLVHGHTPIDKMTGQKPAVVMGPYVYARGLCVNVDGGMYRGGPGFLWLVEQAQSA